MQAAELEVGVAVVGLEELLGAGDVHAELGFGLAGGGVLVGEGIDIGIHAEGGAGFDVEVLGERGDRLKLLLGLDVEEADGVGVAVVVGKGGLIIGGAAEGGDDFFIGLADACVNDLVGGDTGEAGAAELAARDDVEARAEIDEGFQDGEVGAGFDAEADERIQGREGLGEALVVKLERGGGVDIDRRLDASGEGGEVEALAGEATVGVGEMVHGRRVEGARAGVGCATGKGECEKWWFDTIPDGSIAPGRNAEC